MKKFVAALASLGVLASGGAALAHHSGSMFDNTKEVKIVGTIKEFQYTNPHAWLIVSSKDAAGKNVDWAFEFTGGPSALVRVGIKKTTLPAGEKVTVTGNPLKDGRTGGNLVLVTKADGSTVSPRTGPAPARAPG